MGYEIERMRLAFGARGDGQSEFAGELRVVGGDRGELFALEVLAGRLVVGEEIDAERLQLVAPTSS